VSSRNRPKADIRDHLVTKTFLFDSGYFLTVFGNSGMTNWNNMKLSYEWMKDYIDLRKITPEKLADGLTMSGSEVDSIHDAAGDKVMELEITSNRPDCLNILGLAREASAVFNLDLKLPDLKCHCDDDEVNKPVIARRPTCPERSRGKADEAISIDIKNKKLCPLYTAKVIRGVIVKPAGKEIRKKLEALGLRPVNNVVDVTNFCLMELGQPLHAFDLDKIKGGRIIVREAKKGEKIITIDGIERELKSGMLVIADSERPVAVAGIMGGVSAEVTDLTKNILLESAYFDPLSVRRTARELGISSDSSYRFERGVDKEMVIPASFRASNIILKETGGRITGSCKAGSVAADKTVISFDVARAGGLLGVELDAVWVKNVLTRLGMHVTDDKADKLIVKVPSFREDLKTEVDLIEETARIYGYDKVPETMPVIDPEVTRKGNDRLLSEKISRKLISSGLFEIMTYSLISSSSAVRFPDLAGDPVVLVNPLSEEQKVLTPHLLDGMLRTISWNINRKNKDLMLFEMGKIYSRAEKGIGYDEVPALCVGMTGLAVSDWARGKREASFYDIKGIIEEALRSVKINAEFHPAGIAGMSLCAAVEIAGGKSAVGIAGEVSKKILDEYDIDQRVYVAQVKLDEIFKKGVLKNSYSPVPRFPFSTRDVSVLCDTSVKAGDMLREIKRSGGELVQSADIIDIYLGENIPEGKKSLTYSIQYGLTSGTLKDEEIESVHSRVKDTLARKFGVSFR